MTDFADTHSGAPSPHRPVLLAEVLEALAVRNGARIVDGTFGAGGYSRAILLAGGTVLAIDRDPDAVATGMALAQDAGGRFAILGGRFSDLDALAESRGFAPVDGVVLDVGVSSMQLDRAERGFSFRLDGPLDMRMGQGGPSAADVVNAARVEDLTRIIGILGEEKRAGRIARAIGREREAARIETTGRLASVVAAATGPQGAMRIHPATRTFQALRIFVNRELDELAAALGAAEAILREGGRLVVVAFHSLEDRIVKRFFQDRAGATRGSRHAPEVSRDPPTFTLLARGASEPGEAEIAANPRARSARLRAGIRTATPARALDMAAIGVPQLAGIPGPEAFA